MSFIQDYSNKDTRGPKPLNAGSHMTLVATKEHESILKVSKTLRLTRTLILTYQADDGFQLTASVSQVQGGKTSNDFYHQILH